MRQLQFLVQHARWLAAGALLVFMASFGQTYFISVFAGEIRQEFNLSHGEWGGIYTLGTAAAAIAMIWVGGLADRLHVRVLGSVTLGCLALSCLLMAVAPVAWMLPLVIFALRLTGQGMTMQIAVVAMGRWFNASRGKAISVANLGGNVGEAFLPLIFAALLLNYEWRLLWGVAALFVTLSVPVLLGLLVREQSVQESATPYEAIGMEDRHWTRNQAVGHWLFWFMVPALLGPAAVNTAFFFHQVHFASIKGWQHVNLVSLFPAYVGVTVASMVLSGWLLDRVGTARLIPWTQLPLVLCFTLFAQGETLWAAFVGLFLLALTTGANAVIPAAFWAEFYGTRHLGAIKATALAVMVLGTALGPGLSGLLLDVGLGLETQFQVAALYFIVTTVLMKIGVTRARALREAGA
ncbi:MAG: MFS transporter [Pseudomonadota bacterium]